MDAVADDGLPRRRWRLDAGALHNPWDNDDYETVPAIGLYAVAFGCGFELELSWPVVILIAIVTIVVYFLR